MGLMENIIIKLFNYSVDFYELVDEIKIHRIEHGTAAGVNYMDAMARVVKWHNEDEINKIVVEEYNDLYRTEATDLMINSIITKDNNDEDMSDSGEG